MGRTGGCVPFFLLLFILRFYGHSLFGRPSGGCNLFVVRFYGHCIFGMPSGGDIVLFLVFTGRVRQLATSGGPIFRCTTKDRGERRAKGIAIPLNPRGNVLGHSDVLCANLLAMVRLTRLSRAWRAPHCFHALCVLRVRLN